MNLYSVILTLCSLLNEAEPGFPPVSKAGMHGFFEVLFGTFLLVVLVINLWRLSHEIGTAVGRFLSKFRSKAGW